MIQIFNLHLYICEYYTFVNSKILISFIQSLYLALQHN